MKSIQLNDTKYTNKKYSNRCLAELRSNFHQHAELENAAKANTYYVFVPSGCAPG